MYLCVVTTLSIHLFSFGSPGSYGSILALGYPSPTAVSPKCRKNLLELNGVSWAKVSRPSAHSWKEAGELASGFQRCLFMATAVSGRGAKGSSATQLSPEPEDSSESHAGRGPLSLWVPPVEERKQSKERKRLTILLWSLQDASLQPKWETYFLHSLHK